MKDFASFRRWVVYPVAALVLLGGAGFLAASLMSRPIVQASSFWPDTVPGLTAESDVVVVGDLGDLATRYRTGVTGEVGGDPSDDGIAGVVYEFHVTEVLGSDKQIEDTIYVTFLDSDVYANVDRFPRKAVLFAKHAIIDPSDASQLAQFDGNLYMPLGSQGLFEVTGNSARSASPEMEPPAGGERGAAIPLDDLSDAVRASFKP